MTEGAIELENGGAFPKVMAALTSPTFDPELSGSHQSVHENDRCKIGRGARSSRVAEAGAKAEVPFEDWSSSGSMDPRPVASDDPASPETSLSPAASVMRRFFLMITHSLDLDDLSAPSSDSGSSAECAETSDEGAS